MSNRHPYRAEAKRRWPKAIWTDGDAPYACVTRCRDTTVELFATLEAAEHAKQFIDDCGCGGRCCKAHQVVKLA